MANKVGVYVAAITLLMYPGSTCTAERIVSGMNRLKTPLRNTISNGRLSSLAILHTRNTRTLALMML